MIQISHGGKAWQSPSILHIFSRIVEEKRDQKLVEHDIFNEDMISFILGLCCTGTMASRHLSGSTTPCLLVGRPMCLCNHIVRTHPSGEVEASRLVDRAERVNSAVVYAHMSNLVLNEKYTNFCSFTGSSVYPLHNTYDKFWPYRLYGGTTSDVFVT